MQGLSSVDYLGIRVAAVALIAAGGAAAQQDLFDLTTTGDGTSAYFVTALGRKGSGDLVLPGAQLTRIFRVDAAGVALYMERLPVYPPPVTQRGQVAFTNYFQLSHPQTSRDGRVVAVTGQRVCTGGDFCISQTTLQTTVSGPDGKATDVAGAGRLSGNGRFLLTYGAGGVTGPPASVIDLQTGQAADWLAPLIPYQLTAGRVIADDGTVAVAAGAIWVGRPGAITQVQLTFRNAGQAVIDSAGQMVVYSSQDFPAGTHSIRSYRIADQRDGLVADMGNGSASAPYLSSDGRRVMFLSDASGVQQIYTANIDGSGLRQVSRETSGVPMAAMSDDGKVAWYFSGAARLYQMNLDTGAAQEQMGRTPQLGFRRRMAAGSVYTIAGAGLSDGTFAADGYPLPRTLGGVSVAVNGVDAPLYSVSPTRIVMQVPWGTPQDTQVEVRTPGSSPFDPIVTFANTTLSGYGLFLVPAQGSDSLAVHGDWSALVTSANPARPGETIHLYGTGFGNVDTPQQDGVPAPRNAPVRTVVPVTCWAWGADNVTRLDIAVPFTGLLPGAAGYYQMDVRVPDANLRTSLQLACTGEGYNSDFFANFATTGK